MNSLLRQLGVYIRLHFRNKMAMLYSYLFPSVFLVAFWVLYRYESPIISRHLGELLTVTALGGACFGLPTSLVSERERGVWRRYRLAPVHTGALVGSTVVARYLLLLTAGVLQVALAMAIGMPLPKHPLELVVAFTCVCFAFLGLGLVIATLADNVPAVQALGQCIFLPMLIIGGVAVRLQSLPPWAQHLSAFFPGRYAVQAIQACTTGEGLGAGGFSVLALLLIGGAGCVAGAKLFRWDAQQRFATLRGKGWVAVALVAWLAVGGLAESQGIVSGATPRAAVRTATAVASTPGGAAPLPLPSPRLSQAEIDTLAARGTPAPADTGARPAAAAPGATPSAATPTGAAPPPAAATAPPVAPLPPPPAGGWQAVTAANITDGLFQGLPPDEGVVSPIAASDEAVAPDWADQLSCMRTLLPQWAPARVADPVQRARNLLYVAAVPDVLQLDLERFTPLVIFARLQGDFPRDQLEKILYWIATHPNEGDDSASGQLRAICLDISGTDDTDQLRERTRYYALKLLGRLTGRIQQQ
jgi:ABC-type transport system involved in cytochrome c biogenesis permease component